MGSLASLKGSAWRMRTALRSQTTATPRSRIVLSAVAALIALALPLLLQESELLLVVEMLVLALWAVSYNLLLGYTGLVSFGHAAYYSVGAYTVALLWSKYGISPLIGLVASAAVTAIISFFTGLFCLRSVRLYFALLTLAVSQVMFTIVFEWYDFTGGDNGIHGIELPGFLASAPNLYFFVLVVSVVCMLIIKAIVNSPFGGALLCIRENRQRAAFIGIDVKRYELIAFIISSTFSGIAGGLYAFYDRQVFAGLLNWTKSAEPVLVSLIGGMYSFFGPAVGAALFIFLNAFLTRYTTYSALALGALLLMLALVFPGGLAELASLARARLLRRGQHELETDETAAAQPTASERKP